MKRDFKFIWYDICICMVRNRSLFFSILQQLYRCTLIHQNNWQLETITTMLIKCIYLLYWHYDYVSILLFLHSWPYEYVFISLLECNIKDDIVKRSGGTRREIEKCVSEAIVLARDFRISFVFYYLNTFTLYCMLIPDCWRRKWM